jgi:C-terminal peptidase prc
MRALRFLLALLLATPVGASQNSARTTQLPGVPTAVVPTAQLHAPVLPAAAQGNISASTLFPALPPSAAAGAGSKIAAAPPTATALAPLAVQNERPRAIAQAGVAQASFAAAAAGSDDIAESGYTAAGRYFDGAVASAGKDSASAPVLAAPSTQRAPLGLIAHAAGMLRREHVDRPPVEKLLRKALSGILEKAGLTKYSQVKPLVRSLRQALGAQAYGLGVSWQKFPGDPAYIREVQRFSPAEQAGLRAGDIIAAVDGEATDGMEGDALGERLKRGSVKLTILRLDPAEGVMRASETTLTAAAFRYASFADMMPGITAVFTAAAKAATAAVTPSELLDAALDKMAGSLDRHTEYLTAEEKAEMDESFQQPSYGGFGVRFRPQGPGLRVDGVMPGSPADRAGMKVGDEIVMVDGKTVEGDSIDALAKKMRRKVGEPIVVIVERPGGVHERLVMRAEELNLPLAAGGVLPGGVGYLHFTIFSVPAWGTAYEALEDMHARGVRELILDLRFNPGGRLDIANSAAGVFLPAAKLVTILKSPRGGQPYTTKREGGFKDMKIVILLNRASASASEVLSAALRDHGAAVIVGETSHGKGSGQVTHPLLDGRALKITTFKWLTPKGRNITQGDGLAPDLPVPSTEDQLRPLYESMMLRLYDSSLPKLGAGDPALDAAYRVFRP